MEKRKYMITEQNLKEAVWKKYIRPTERASKHVSGLEFEFPIVNLTGGAVDFEVVHRAAEDFAAAFQFTEQKRDDDGALYFAEDPVTSDTLSFDCSFNTLEFSFGAEKNLNTVYERFRSYFIRIQDLLLEKQHCLTGMGINPGWRVNRIQPVRNGRYRMLLHHLSSYPAYGDAVQFHHYPHYGIFSCASQTQLDAERDSLPEMLNTFNRLEPLKALLFANSPFHEADTPDFLLSRDYFWRQSMHGVNPHNVDGYGVHFQDVDEIAAYYMSMSMYCLERDGKYINFAPNPLREYFRQESVTGEYFDGETYRKITFSPDLSDLTYLRSFKFDDLTYRGTVECRSVCEQPVSEIMAPAAFQEGLVCRLHELSDLLEKDRTLYHKGYSAMELRNMLVRRNPPEIAPAEDVQKLLLQVVSLAEAGLKDRGFGEEKYLEPVFRHAENLTNPAAEMLRRQEKGEAPGEIIRDYGSLA